MKKKIEEKETNLRLRGHWEYPKASSIFFSILWGPLSVILDCDPDQYSDAIVAVH
jgi:hypothetical protein